MLNAVKMESFTTTLFLKAVARGPVECFLNRKSLFRFYSAMRSLVGHDRRLLETNEKDT